MIRVHFLGIAGSGASAVAAIAQAQGFEVTGCDLSPDNEFTKVFSNEQLMTGHSAAHLADQVDILAVTPAVLAADPKNSELIKARKQGTVILTWQQFMGKYLQKEKFVVAVAGTHGKSTTTAMVACLLEDANLDPTVELGAIVPKWQANYRIGQSKYFVTEADEFNDNFLASQPDILVLTNIEMDHPEYFKDFDSYKNSFRRLLDQVRLKIIANLSDPGVREVMESYQKDKAMYKNGQIVQITDYSKSELNFPLKTVGYYNQQNAAAAYQAGLALDIDPSIIRHSLMAYSGIGRRFEYLGELKGALIYSDFGHHPTEIKLTVEAVRQTFKDKRLIVIFQPHMFTRTKVLLNDFVKVFRDMPAEQIFITDIYASREKATGLISSQELVKAIDRKNTAYLPKDKARDFLSLLAKKEVVMFFIGAGDIDQIARGLIKE